MPHHRFARYPHKTLLLCEEAYTSKTCCKCGAIHKTLGGNKVFKCKACGNVMDRDHNGAINIFIRFIALYIPIGQEGSTSVRTSTTSEGIRSDSTVSRDSGSSQSFRTKIATMQQAQAITSETICRNDCGPE